RAPPQTRRTCGGHQLSLAGGSDRQVAVPRLGRRRAGAGADTQAGPAVDRGAGPEPQSQERQAAGRGEGRMSLTVDGFAPPRSVPLRGKGGNRARGDNDVSSLPGTRASRQTTK